MTDNHLQLESNESAKRLLLRDWALKQEAINLDNRSAAMVSGDTKNVSLSMIRAPNRERLESRNDGAGIEKRMSEQ